MAVIELDRALQKADATLEEDTAVGKFDDYRDETNHSGVRSEETSAFLRVLQELQSLGILLLSDDRLPSVSSLVAGAPVRGSWWAHPQGHIIFAIAEELAAHPDVLVTKLVSGKVTYVHRKLWPALVSVAISQQPWQMRGLSPYARSLLNRVTKEGELRLDRVRPHAMKTAAPGQAARELEGRLLVYSEQIHTATGAHSKHLESWERWAERVGFKAKKMQPDRARQRLEKALHRLNRQFQARGWLPWMKILLLVCSVVWSVFTPTIAAAGERLHLENIVALQRDSEFEVQIRSLAEGTSWEETGREAALLKILIDDRYDQHLILAGGAREMVYSFLVGPLAPGQHTLRIEWDKSWTPALQAKPEVRAVEVFALDRNDAAHEPILRAPILYIRKDTVGRFSDVPLLLYWEREDAPFRTRRVTYTTVFSNEDGGTEAEHLMARWGRTTDIEWCYSYSIINGRFHEEFQGADHKTLLFRGQKEGWHPILYDATLNNNFADFLHDAPEFRVRMLPVFADLKGRARETIMDRYPWTYSIMAGEMIREKKIEAGSDPNTSKLSDLRNYAYLEVCSRQRDTELYFELQLKGSDLWFSSHHGDPKARIGRSGCVRSTVELPPGLGPRSLRALRIRCNRAPPPKGERAVHRPKADLNSIMRLFFLKEDYQPAANLVELELQKTLKPGQSLTLSIR